MYRFCLIDTFGILSGLLVCYTQHRIENALAFYDKVVDIWYKFLASVRNDAELADTLTESQLQEGMDMLNFILQTRAKLLGQPHIATGEAKYTLGLLYLFMENKPAAHECISAACDIYTKHLGPEHPSTRDVLEVLQHLSKETSLFSGRGLDSGNGAQAPQSEPGDDTFAVISDHFPKDMPRAATQSPIPMPPGERADRT